MPDESEERRRPVAINGGLSSVSGYDDWVDPSEDLARNVRDHLKDISAIEEYPQAQFIVPDAELYTVLKMVSPGGVHSMPRSRRRRIIDEFRLRAEFPETPDLEVLQQQLDQTFHDAEDIDDLDAVRDTFAVKITAIICAGNEQTLSAVARLIEDESISCEVTGIALEVIGSMLDPPSHRDRRLLLEKNLRSPDATIRTGAVIGLSNLSNPLSLDVLRSALDVETDDPLRSLIQSTVNRLEDLGP